MADSSIAMTPVADEAPVHVRQAMAVCEAHKGRRIRFVVPRKQLGVAVRDALYRTGVSAPGASFGTLRQLAQDVTAMHPERLRRQELSGDLAAIWLRTALDDLEAPIQDALAVGGSLRHLAVPISRALRTLRENAIPVEAMHDLAAQDDAGQDRKAVAACYARYVDFLTDADYYDDADLLRWATEQIREGRAPRIPRTVVAVYDALTVAEEEARLLQALCEHAVDVVRIGGAGIGIAPPETSVAARFETVGVPEVQAPSTVRGPAGLDPEQLTFATAVGSANEVRQVLRTILEAEIPLDDVEIAFPEGDRYRSLLASTAEALGLDASLSTGRPATATRPGQALDGFYEWIANGFNAAQIIHLLRAQLITIKPFQDGQDEERPTLTNAEAASLLAQRRYSSGENEGPKQGYENAFANWKKELRKDVQKLQAAYEEGSDELETRLPRVENELANVEQLEAIVNELFSLAPGRKERIAEVARKSLEFLDTFGPVQKDTKEIDEVKRSPDEAGDKVLKDELNRLKDAPLAEAVAPDALQMVRQIVLENKFVQGLRPLPGRLHLVPLESAGYTGRRHLFVVGMDAESLSTSVTESALLLDAERETLRKATGIAISKEQDAPDEEAWAAVQALWRHAGPATFFTRTYDVENAEDVFPSSLYLRLKQAARLAAKTNGTAVPTEAKTTGMRPPAEAEVALSDRDVWLSTPAHRLSDADREPAGDVIQSHFPGVEQGATAAQARASEEYTVYDGLLDRASLSEDDATHLDLRTTRRPLSATRLQTLAEAPYVYFLKYVLGVRPLDEPALDDTAWLDIRQKGNVLHSTFETFMKEMKDKGRTPTPEDLSRLEDAFEAEIGKQKRQLSPPSEHVERAVVNELWEDAKVFLNAEIRHAEDGFVPEAFEYGFGYPDHRKEDQDAKQAANLALPSGATVEVRGRIDRVDVKDGAVYLWDYKTGSQRHFDTEDPLQDGATLQWALYALAYEDLTGERVARSGYFFTSVREMGARLGFDPSTVTTAVPALIDRLADEAREGRFAMAPRLHDARPWSYGDFDRIVPDLRARGKVLRAKTPLEG